MDDYDLVESAIKDLVSGLRKLGRMKYNKEFIDYRVALQNIIVDLEDQLDIMGGE